MNINIDKLIDFIKNKDKLGDKYIPDFVVEEYKIHRKNDYKFYKNLKSNNQIFTIYRYRKENPVYYFNLVRLIQHYFKMDLFEIQKILREYNNDYQIYSYIRNNVVNRKQKNYKKPLIFFNKIKLIHIKIKQYILDINKDYLIDTYLDFGCGSGKNTYNLAKYLNLAPKNVWATDIDNWYDIGFDRDKYVENFVQMKDNKIPLEDNKFSLVTCFMVLHHVKDLDKALKEIYRVLKPGGYLLITEHCAGNDYDRMLIDIQHAFFELVFRNTDKYKYYSTYYGKYYDRFAWHYIMSKYKLKLTHHDSKFYSESVRHEIFPTRYFYSVYKKI